ncbi:hypothetical protein FHS15_001429 [Paenibacillus castaneae]|nr:hypothetical protein [Paenibacillus castaneae]
MLRLGKRYQLILDEVEYEIISIHCNAARLFG